MKIVKYEIRKSVLKNGIIIREKDTNNVITVENDYIVLGIDKMFNITYSNIWYTIRILFRLAFGFNKIKPVFHFLDNFDYEKYHMELFAGLEELGVVTKKEFYRKHIEVAGMHPGEPIWMGEEYVELNKSKFIKYLERHKN